MDRSNLYLRRSNSRYQKPWQEKFKDYVRFFIAFMFTNVGIVGLVVGYTIAGAFVFIAIEGKQSQDLLESLQAYRNDTADSLWELTYNENVFNEDTWRKHVTSVLFEYQLRFVQHAQNGYDPKNLDSWSFSGAFLYSLTVITTIGYGNLVPRTGWGKFATVIYAIAGMPLFLLYLSNIGDILAKSFKWTYFKMCLCRGCPGSATFRRKRIRHEIQLSRLQPQQDDYFSHRECQASHAEESNRGNRKTSIEGGETENEDSDDEESEEDENSVVSEEQYDPQAVTVPISLCLAIMVGYIYGGAMLFTLWETWDPLEGSYFCFISLSTIGFGDIVPGEKIYSSDDTYLSFSFIATAIYLMLGMALIAMCFNLMQEEVIHKTRTYIKACKSIFSCCRRDAIV